MLKRAGIAAEVLDRRTACVSALRPRFFDSGNAIWGHPFVSLHVFLDSVVEWTGAPLSGVDRDEVLDVYLTGWRDHLDADPQVLRSDLAATEALVGVHRLVS